MSNFTKRKRQNEENLEEIVKNSEDSEFSDDIDISEYMSKRNSSEKDNDDTDSDTQPGKFMKAGTEQPCFTFVGKFRKSPGMF